MREPVAGLSERLLRGGISPARVARYAAELDEHLEDLTAELAAAGLPPEQARAVARQRLGDPDLLAASMLAQPGLRSLPSRLPAFAWLALPLIAELAIVAGLAALVVAAARTASCPPRPPSSIRCCWWRRSVSPGASGGVRCGVGAGVGWPLAGMLVTLIAAAALELSIGADAVAVSLRSPTPDILAVYALLTIAPFLLLHRHLRAH
jgi:hypothetical protein